jgi:hypothetical protein
LTNKLDQVGNLKDLNEKALQAVNGNSKALTNDQLSASILQTLICRHNGSNRIFNRRLVNRKRIFGTSDFQSRRSGAKSMLTGQELSVHQSITIGKQTAISPRQTA